ncbi:hypothetical protein SO078_18465 (plasmid) [Sinorhizobium meliloti]|nr:hypothetical protein [Sinorhizobium meliloti]WRQ70457.1 hypothetical protein SO078_18465 [Sinorhizobium meliloti]
MKDWISRQLHIAGDEFGKPLVNQQDVGLDAAQAAGKEAPDHRVTQLVKLIGKADLVLGELPAGADQLGELFAQRIDAHFPRRHVGGVASDHDRVEAVVLGQATEGAGEVAQLVRVDIADRQAGLAQRLFRPALVAAARLQADRSHPPTPQPLQKQRPAGRVVVDAKTLSRFQNGDVQPPFGDIDTDHQTLFSHLFHPFLAVRGLAPCNCSGSKRKAVGPQLIHGIGT